MKKSGYPRTRPGSVTTTYAYDAHWNLSSVTDAESRATTYTYDDMGRLVSTVSPDTGTTTYSYDSRGNPVTKSDAEGIAVTYGYDDLSRLTAINYPAYGSMSAWSAAYTYDQRTNGKGRLSNITAANGPLAFDYDARGRLIQRKTTLNSVQYVLTRTFTPAGRVTGLTYPISGRTVTFARSTACECHVEEIKTKLGELETVLLENIAYRPFGSPNAVDFGSGGKVSNIYNLDGRITAGNLGKPKQKNYGYDHSGRLLSISSFATVTHWQNRTYGYDGLGRLTSVSSGPFSDLSFVHDGVGNRQEMWADGVLDTMYSYASGTNRIDTVVQGMDTTAYTYDARGNPTSRTANAVTRSFVFNQANQLTRAHEGGSNLGLYRYNGLNQRIRKEAGGAITYYVYDFDGNLIQEALPDGTIQKEYFYWGDTRLAGIEYRTDPDPDLLFFFHNDSLGTPELITDSTKTVIWEAIYFPFGEAVVNSNSSVVNNFRLPGQYYDAETGLHYNWHRYYDPSTGRYLTPDPIGLAGGINPYVYVGNDPVNGMDPMGLSKSSNPFDSDDPLVQALREAIPQGKESQAYKDAMKAIKEQLEKNCTSRGRKKILRGAVKMAKAPAKYATKYGIKMGVASLGILVDAIMVEKLNAEEPSDYGMYLIQEEINKMEENDE